MIFSKLKLIFTIIIIGIVYMIIFTALKIMSKDVKNGNRTRVKRRKTYGLEILEPGKSLNLKRGGVIPIRDKITIGRKEGNLFTLDDPYVSGFHAKIYPKNSDYILEDLNSTNGTTLNGDKVNGKSYLKVGDTIKIGNTVFKVIG